MSKVSVAPQEISIFITPAELRQIADRMEALCTEIQPGDDKTAAVFCGKDVVISLVIDQTRMPKR